MQLNEEIHIGFMQVALIEARQALLLGEVPIGCVITKNGEIVSKGHNTRETAKNALGHAELMAIDGACDALGGWRLFDCTMYVTLEPCPMCMGAAINARVGTIVFGAADEKAGCCGSVIHLGECNFNHRPKIIRGIMQDECKQILSDFFSDIREKRKKSMP